MASARASCSSERAPSPSKVAPRSAETPPNRPYVLYLGSGGGGAFATSGTRGEMTHFAIELLKQIVQLPDEPLPGWDVDDEDEDEEDDDD